MKNVNGYPTNCIERKYDLKGSSYSRSTLDPAKDIPLNELKFYDAMKDLDFNKYEEKLWIPDDLKGEVNKILKRDSQFLSSLGLIDYSLVVYIVNKENLDRLIEDHKKKSKKSKDSAYMVEVYQGIKTHEKRKSQILQRKSSLLNAINNNSNSESPNKSATPLFKS